MSNQGPYGPPPGQYQQPPPPQQYGPPPGGPQWRPPGPPPGPQAGPPHWPPPPGPPPGPGFGWGSNGFPPPPKKKSKTGWILVPLALLALVIGGAEVSQVLKHNGDHDYADPESTSSVPTLAPTTRDTVPTGPVTQPTATKPTKTTPPPPPPPPPPSDNDLVTKNRLYKTRAQKTVNCREPGPKPNSMTNARKYYSTILACLSRAWPRQVAAAGARFRAPKLVVFTGSVYTPCSGGSDTGYFYCSANETIYLDGGTDVQHYGQYSQGWGGVYTRADATDTVAHEFGHHVQNMTGILGAEDDLAYDSNSAKALELSRRLELQASCFGSVFLTANKRSYPISGQFKKDLDFINSHQGDDYNPARIRDHGSRFSYARWTKAGESKSGVAACNTFLAAAKNVG